MRPRLSRIAALLLLAPGLARAQSPSQTARAFSAAPHVLGMGDAGVAFPAAGGVFFYNPAHLTSAAGLRPRVHLLSVRLDASSSLYDQFNFYRKDLKRAIEKGFDDPDVQENLDSLYAEVLRLSGGARTYAGADINLPSVMMRVGPVAAGTGAFVASNGRYAAFPGGAGVPTIEAAGYVDAMAVASAAVDLARAKVPGLSVGVSLKFTRRFLTLKSKPLDAFSRDETANIFTANATGLDAGLSYRVPGVPVGEVRVAAAGYDLISTGFRYRFQRTIKGPSDLDTPADVLVDEREQADASFRLSPSYRVGVAYTTPGLFGFLRETGVALDYQGYADPYIPDQPLAARLHVGVQASLARVFSVRAGVSQGYSTFGAGLRGGGVRLDYAYFGREESRLPGQAPSWNHTVQLGVGF